LDVHCTLVTTATIIESIVSGSGIISKSELKYFYTAFMDVGKLGEQRLDEITTNAYRAMTSVSTISSLHRTLCLIGPVLKTGLDGCVDKLIWFSLPCFCDQGGFHKSWVHSVKRRLQPKCEKMQ
jgi:hypothetical protein